MRLFTDFRSCIETIILCTALCSVLILSGCSSRQATQPPSYDNRQGQSYRPEERVSTPNFSSLNEEEKSIFAERRGIAKAVPASGIPALKNQYAKYLRGNGRKTIIASSKRAEKYLRHVKTAFRSKGLPEELAYLAIVESGYNVKARSHAGAAGAWQFMPFTGMKYGLNRDKYQDERLDIYKASFAAASYLKALHNRFGDWPTAIAAYNAGEGKMGRACAAANESTFYGVCTKNGKLNAETRLKPETTQYVSRFLAVSIIMQNLERLGFSSIHPERYSTPAHVDLPPGTNLDAMAQACHMSWQEFSAQNPHIFSHESSPEMMSTIYVPQSQRLLAETYSKNPVISSGSAIACAMPQRRVAQKSSRQRSPKFASYRLEAGESLSAFARKHGSDVRTVLASNNIKDPNRIPAGTILRVPAKDKTVPVSRPAKARAVVAGSLGKMGKTSSYRVQANDTLWQISRKFNVSIDNLKKWNNLHESGRVYVGQNLIVQAR